MVHRPRLEVYNPSQSWTERADSATKKLRSDGRPRKFSGLYRDDEVRQRLESLFAEKCAFCEKSWDDKEVEHFRPKGGVVEDSEHQGYYWLAYTWSNLYPTCVRCNQRRSDVSAPTTGKGNHFALADESKRARVPTDNLELEEPLLLDPCVDNPDEHLYIGITGRVEPLVDDNARARYTIDVFGLNRDYLVKARRDIFLRALRSPGAEELTPEREFLATWRAAAEFRS